MEISITIPQNEQHEIKFLDVQLSATDARLLMLALLNSRIDYHNAELFGEMERNGKLQDLHRKSLDQLARTRLETDNLLLKAMSKQLNVTLKGKLNIVLSHDSLHEKPV